MFQRRRQLQKCVASHVPSILSIPRQVDNLNTACLDYENMIIEELLKWHVLDRGAHDDN